MHSHYFLLIWIRGWDIVFQNLGSTCESTRKMFEDVLMNYASKIMTTKIFGKNSAIINSPCGLKCPERLNGLDGMKKCDLQSIRNLRRKDGETNLGEKAIIFCDTCKTGHTSEDIAIALLCRVLGRQKVLENGILPTYKDAFWEKNGFVSKAFIHADVIHHSELIPMYCQ